MLPVDRLGAGATESGRQGQSSDSLHIPEVSHLAMVPTSLAGASDGPLVPSSAPLEGASPEVLWDLNSLWLRQLRDRALGWGLVVFVAIGLLVMSNARPGGSLYFLIGLIGLNSVRVTVEWWRARRQDPLAAAADSADAALERDRLQQFQERLASRRSVATGLIAGLVLALALIEWLTTGSTAVTVARAGLLKPLVSDGEWWRLVTAMFLHANAWHLSSNLAALGVFGRIVEAYAPRAWLLITYGVSGVAGNLASWWVKPDTASLGASGAVMGILAFLLVLGWRRPDELPASVRQRAGMAILMTAFIGAMAFSLIDNAAHAGGAAAGALVALIVIPKQASAFRGRPSRFQTAAGWLAATAIVAGAVRAAIALNAGAPVLAAVMPSARDVVVPIMSVAATMDRDAAGWQVVVRNNSDRVLEAYEISIAGAGTTGRLWRDDCCFGPYGSKPVPPGTWTRIGLGDSFRNSRIAPRASLSLVLFADGSFEGSSRSRDEIFRRRAQVVDEATFWIKKIEAVSPIQPEEAVPLLEAHIRARSMFGDASARALKAFRLGDLVTVALHDPARFVDEAARTKSLIQASRETLLVRIKR